MNKIIRIPLFIISLVFMLIFFSSLVIKLPNSNVTIIITGISLLLTIISLKIFFKQNKKIHFMRILNILLNIACICFIFLFIFTEYRILTKSNLKEMNKSDFIIVLGAALNGKTPSHALLKRLEASIILINANPEAKIILSGGEGPGEEITEAEAMKRYLVSMGVNPDNIIKEEKATNTFENIMYSSEIIDEFNMDSPRITIVTSNSHMYRTLYICNKLDLKVSGYTSPVWKGIEAFVYFREFFAVFKTWLFY